MVGEAPQEAGKVRSSIGCFPESCIVVEANEVYDRDCGIGNANHSWARRSQTRMGTLALSLFTVLWSTPPGWVSGPAIWEIW